MPRCNYESTAVSVPRAPNATPLRLTQSCIDSLSWETVPQRFRNNRLDVDAEDSHGHYTPPWPYAIPVCDSGGKPPHGWTACLPGPQVNPWLYHYFTEPPALNQGFEARGGAWYIEHAAAAFRAGNITDAALYLSCFAHGLEDRSSPYHNFGGFEAQRTAIDTKYELTATCKAHRADGARCFVLFWASNDAGIDVSVPGYTPILLANDTASAGTVVGGRMEEISAASRQLTVMPGGYVDLHLRDPDWWNDSAVPSSATRDVMGRMAQLSTRLVADAWYTAWTLSQRPASSALTEPSVELGRGGAGSSGMLSGSDSGYERRWQLAVSKAALYDRLETRLS